MLISPSNPTGGVYTSKQLEALARVLRNHSQVMIMSDDIYEHLVFDGRKFTSILNVAPDLVDRVLIVNGVSKVFAMTGWRLGYGAGPKALIARMNTVQGQSSTHASSISQAASNAALNGPIDFIAERATSFQARRDVVVTALGAVQELSVLSAEGAFYLYPNCAGLVRKRTSEGVVLSTDADVCTWLLEWQRVSVVSGIAFGLSPYLRISTAASKAQLSKACGRIATAVATLEPTQ